jgi:hypothetical protein
MAFIKNNLSSLTVEQSKCLSVPSV